MHANIFQLEAKSAREARSEIKSRWPMLNVQYKGYDEDDELVIMSLVRKRGDKASVATVSRNHSKRAVRFEAEVPNP